MGKIKDQIFIERANKIHNNFYNYSKIEYDGTHNKILIICPMHGEFWQTPHDHLKGCGCPKCGQEKKRLNKTLSEDEVIKRFKKIHGDTYDYSKFHYTKMNENSTIICKKHGEFLQTPRKHLMGSGCKKCGYEKNTSKKLKSIDTFQREIKNTNITLTNDSIYVNYYTPIEMYCCAHGLYKAYPNNILRGNGGCPECAKILRKEKISSNTTEFIEKSKKIFGDIFDYSKVNYINNKTKITLICKKCGKDFEVRPDNHLSHQCGCPHCSHPISKWEQEINDYIVSFGLITEQSKRDILLNSKEIDIFIPKLNIGIECDGLYWHNELFKDRNYHLEKTKNAENKGIKLIHIYEDEWKNKKEIVKSILKNNFGLTENKIYARKCQIINIDEKTKKEFLINNHIQGNCNSSINYGLIYNNELVSLMTFGKLRKNLGSQSKDNCYELLRFVNKINYNIIGGASKLFKHFIKEYNPLEIISYCDIRLFDGNLYEQLGFIYEHSSQPNYFYVLNDERKNRFNYRKDILVKEGFNKNKTEHEIMLEREIYRIYDCGCKKYCYKK